MARASAGSEPEKWDPRSRETADHSLPYLIAVALRDGAVTPDSFAMERVLDPDLRPLMRKVNVSENPEFTRQHPPAQMARLEVVTKSGARFSEECSYPKGHCENPLTDEELEKKFHGLAQVVLDAGSAPAFAGHSLVVGRRRAHRACVGPVSSRLSSHTIGAFLGEGYASSDGRTDPRGGESHLHGPMQGDVLPRTSGTQAGAR